ncbi:hypothetical protein N7466_007394 [Penicillium verhagenii]|uniref:uncharacterized protein n=1 Tax=Penicillium verhagenii TaxID=1562060 RepID=UPI0025457330|nr:uncharacterized protein N7466_007394 [Penicillium verhagenii]KAJ5928438.1 hypothetical protein N7466_007394 [Penicillium verhagenii]
MHYPSPYGPTSASWVLGNDSNTRLPIYDGDDDPVVFHEHVNRFYEILEKAFDYQSAAIAAHPKLCASRSYLEGWDFESLATERDPILARATKLDSAGMAWVDLIRSVRAITLFGREFGDIIHPVDACSKWSRVPCGKSYLVISHEDLKDIVDSWCGDLHSSPRMLTDKIIWHTSNNTSTKCRCIPAEEIPHSDIAQVLLPSTVASQIPGQKLHREENEEGAYIFGLNPNNLWHWPETGDPSPPPTSLVCKHEHENGPSVSHENGVGERHDSTSLTQNGSQGQYPVQRREELLRQPSTLLTSDSYTIGIICALHLELMAVQILFDSTHEVAVSSKDPNSYRFGSINQHNVVTTCLPDGEYGTNSAASVASNMKRSFGSLQICLFVGIGGGAPSARHDIRLGDVVVSTPVGKDIGVIQYDMIKTLENGRSQMNGYLQPPPRTVRSVLSVMQSDPKHSRPNLGPYLQAISDANGDYGSPDVSTDNLYESLYSHPEDMETCDGCDVSMIRPRLARTSRLPRVHYGLIGSGNQVMRDAKIRDALAKKHNVLCFEMEAAGVMNVLPSLIIRGICDYSDSHKNNRWQKYAAATAAAYTKLLLSHLKPGLDSKYILSSLDQQFSFDEPEKHHVWIGGRKSSGDDRGTVKRQRTMGTSFQSNPWR